MSKRTKAKPAAKPQAKDSQPWPATEVEMRDAAQLTPYARNPRAHSNAQVAQIAASIKEWGWTVPILVDEEGTLIAGHGRLLAAQQLGITKVPCMVARGWTEAQKRAYVIADNQLTLNGTWNRELLQVELGELIDAPDFDINLLGFKDLELKGLLQDAGNLEDGYAKTMERPEDPATQLGDTWLLGRHRLRCGDSTDEQHVVALLDGAKPLLMVTDPLYGVDYDPEWRGREGISSVHSTGKVRNDDRFDWGDAWKLFPGAVAYIWHASQFCVEVGAGLLAAGFEVRAQIIWKKNQFVPSRGNYHWQHEPCFYAVRKGKTAQWIGDRKQSTIWEMASIDRGDQTIHSTQKPLEAMGRAIRNHDAEEVYEPFAGSGTTLIACQELGRRCFAMELDPGYCDLIVARWQDRTGEKATLERSGETFDAVQAMRAF